MIENNLLRGRNRGQPDRMSREQVMSGEFSIVKPPFKYGDCEIVTLDAAVDAVKHGYDDFTVVQGQIAFDDPEFDVWRSENGLINHTWFEDDGRIVDPTASMFTRPIEYVKALWRYSPAEFVKNAREDGYDV